MFHHTTDYDVLTYPIFNKGSVMCSNILQQRQINETGRYLAVS